MKAVVQFRGREQQYMNLGTDLLNKLAVDVADIGRWRGVASLRAVPCRVALRRYRIPIQPTKQPNNQTTPPSHVTLTFLGNGEKPKREGNRMIMFINPIQVSVLSSVAQCSTV